MPATGNKPVQKTMPGERFGMGVVIDPEVRVRRQPRANGRPRDERCARLQCDCGNIYLAQIRFLINGTRKSCGCMRRGRRRAPGGRVYPNKGGYTVWVYVGWYKNRHAAEATAVRARAVVVPQTSPITGI